MSKRDLRKVFELFSVLLGPDSVAQNPLGPGAGLWPIVSTGP